MSSGNVVFAVLMFALMCSAMSQLTKSQEVEASPQIQEAEETTWSPKTFKPYQHGERIRKLVNVIPFLDSSLTAAGSAANMADIELYKNSPAYRTLKNSLTDIVKTVKQEGSNIPLASVVHNLVTDAIKGVLPETQELPVIGEFVKSE